MTEEMIQTEANVPYSKQLRADGKSLITVSNGGKAEPAIEALSAEFSDGERAYKAELGLKRELRKALKGAKNSQFEGQQHDLVFPVYVASVASIQTPTSLWESNTSQWLEGKVNLETYLTGSEEAEIRGVEDGRQKLECIRNVMETDIIERAQNELRRNHLTEAVKLLSGEEHDVSTYLRGTKAWMVVRWFYHVPCIDTNVHAAIKDILVENLDVRPIHHHTMSENAKSQATAKCQDGNGKISPVTKKWIQERVGRYNQHSEMKALWQIVDKAVRMETDIPREVLAQVAFNVGGEKNNDSWTRTTHLPVYRALGENLSRFE